MKGYENPQITGKYDQSRTAKAKQESYRRQYKSNIFYEEEAAQERKAQQMEYQKSIQSSKPKQDE